VEKKISYVEEPDPWSMVTPVFDETILVGELPPNTIYPVTETQWITGYDPTAPSVIGETPTTNFHGPHRLILVQEFIRESRRILYTRFHNVLKTIQ